MKASRHPGLPGAGSFPVYKSSGFGLRLSDLTKLAPAAFLAGFLLAGCMLGPDYHRPSPLPANSIPANFSGAAGTNAPEWKPTEPSAHLPRGAWWQMFDDSELGQLEALADAYNQKLAGALARFDEARAAVGVAQADLFPQVQLDPSYSRQRTSFNQPQNGNAAQASPTYNTFTASLQAGWEVDLWGRVRRQAQAARAQLAASAADMEGVRLSIRAEVAADYFTLRDLDA